jgi:hypothetical protein
MSSFRVLPAVLALTVVLAACQSPETKAVKDEVKVAQGVEAVCAARVDVDAALETVNGLTPQSTIGDAEKAGEQLKTALAKLEGAEEQLSRAEVKEYRDQVTIFRKEVEMVSKDKSLTLEQAAEKLKGKAAPVVAAREQLAATTVCVEIDETSAPKKDGAKTDEKPQEGDKGQS